MKCDFELSSEFRAGGSILGLMTELELKSGRPRKFKIEEVGNWFYPAILMNQNIIFADPLGQPFGFITWAHVARDVEARLRSEQTCRLVLEEWNEGDHLWLIDAVSARGDLTYHFEWAKANLAVEGRTVSWRQRIGDFFTGPLVEI